MTPPADQHPERNVLAAEAVLHRRIRGPVRFDPATRALFATDASNYRHVPTGVVQPLDVDDALAALEVCREHDLAVVPRGAATSTSGQACNEAVVLDFARFPAFAPEVDAETRTAFVAAGTVLDDLNVVAARHGLRFGPDPSTHSRCTLGGMIGNNSCGAHSISSGKTVDNVDSLDVLLYDGTRLDVGATPDAALDALCADAGRVGALYRDLREIRDVYGDAVRASYPTLPRRVSGYNLDQLLPERGFHVARALVGTEGTCVLVLGARVKLVEAPGAVSLAAIGFPDMFAAAECVPELLDAACTAVEGMDEHLVAAYRSRRPASNALELLPDGGGWLLVETAGATSAEARRAAQAVVDRLRASSTGAVVYDDPAVARALWRIREDGAGIATRRADGTEAWPGWEDAAVPPDQLATYLRGLQSLLDAEDLHAVVYGHFGDGCVHARVDFDLQTDPGITQFRGFVEAAADLVVGLGGSLSGEHGDGQARAELLPKMFPPQVIDAFGAFKAAFDPLDRMNPRTVVRPRAIDDDLRVHGTPVTIESRPTLALHADAGDLGAATRRCVGVGRCLNASGGVMCPSYRVTREERDSPRGRSHLLFEMLSGEVVADGWRSEAVREALDLCLGCKGCKSDCPVNVDVATYKAEFLHRHYAGRVRPVSHYSMGQLPRWLRCASKAPSLFNAVAASRMAPAFKRLGGIAPERELPRLPSSSFSRQFRRSAPPGGSGSRGRVVVFPDTFTNYLEPDIGHDAVAVLTELGYAVEVPSAPVCCGLTWLSTGQIRRAQRVLRRSLSALAPWLEAGVPVVGLEPSCTALLRADARELLPGDRTAAAIGAGVRTFAELVVESEPAWDRPAPRRALVQTHCHQHADLGFATDQKLLELLGVEAVVLDEGCCGLAGNFGFEREHYDISRLVAEAGLLPAVERAEPDVAIVSDGFSCRTQIRDLAAREPVHLARVAAEALGLRTPQRS